MMKLYFHDINNAIKTLHNNYGIGDILEIRQFADGNIEIDAKGYGMKPHTRRGTVETLENGRKRIKLYGHQRTVTII